MNRRTGKKVQTSMRGIAIDMDAMRAQQEESVAIGNARMNARGDMLRKGGEIEIRREQVIRDFYSKHPQGMNQVSLKAAMPDKFESPAEAMGRMVSATKEEPAPAPVAEASEELDKPKAVADKKTRKLVDKSE